MPPLTSAKLDQIVRDIEQLRPLPASTTRVLRALEDPKVSAVALAELVGLDQALTANVLRLANSAFMGYVTPCTSVHQAIVRVGFERLRMLVLGVSASQTFRGDLKGYEMANQDLWLHALSSASLARYLASLMGQVNTEEAYVAGLLHDIGKVVLDHYVLVDHDAMAELMQQQELLLWEAEKQLLGADHGAVGGLMTERWLFPVALVDAIRYHHAPSSAGSRNQPLAAIINIANALAARSGEGLTALDKSSIHPDALRILKIDETGMENLKANMPDFSQIDLRPFDR